MVTIHIGSSNINVTCAQWGNHNKMVLYFLGRTPRRQRWQSNRLLIIWSCFQDIKDIRLIRMQYTLLLLLRHIHRLLVSVDVVKVRDSFIRVQIKTVLRIRAGRWQANHVLWKENYGDNFNDVTIGVKQACRGVRGDLGNKDISGNNHK